MRPIFIFKRQIETFNNSASVNCHQLHTRVFTPRFSDKSADLVYKFFVFLIECSANQRLNILIVSIILFVPESVHVISAFCGSAFAYLRAY